MKFILPIVWILLFSFVGLGQDNSAYETLTSEASLCHLQKRYKEGIAYYEKAFSIRQPDALTAYKAAGMYALDSNRVKAFEYLHLALNKGWTEPDWLVADPYFNYLKDGSPAEWKNTVQEAYEKENRYGVKLRLPLLRKKINQLTLTDQELRYLKIQNNDPVKGDSISRAIAGSDEHNLQEAKLIIEQYGWPKISDIGRDGAHNLWLIIQHSDQDILFQRHVLGLMRKMKNSGELDLENYAFLFDRVQCGLNHRQYYGTQVRWSEHGKATGFRPIRQEGTVDLRRQWCGMTTLKIYALTYGFNYLPISEQTARQSELDNQQQVRLLMDSAGYYYHNKKFNKVYDAYNAASGIQGGMNNKANYTAAIQCAKIGRMTHDQAFIDIAMDFLVLLYKRGALRNAPLQKEQSFIVLNKEERWLKIIHGDPIP